MNNAIATTQNSEITMTHLQLAKVTGKLDTNVKRTMRSLASDGHIQLNQYDIAGTINGLGIKGQDVTIYEVNERDSYIVVAQVSAVHCAVLVDDWIELKKEKRPSSTGNAMLDAVIESQRQLNEVKVQVDKQQLKIEDLESLNYIMNERPANMDGITAIKDTISKRHGLPGWLVHMVMHTMSYSPKPGGQVKKTHEYANGGNYTVWYKVEVTKLFARFVSECTMETKTKATHPSIDLRFKLIIKEIK